MGAHPLYGALSQQWLLDPIICHSNRNHFATDYLPALEALC